MNHIRIRIDVVMHFISRWRKGIDSYSVVEQQLEELYARLKWMDKHKDRLESVFLYD
ncbi:hypothetical protein M3625_21645 [Paenibacillus sp. MER 78]|nr:hypothetical protein [Paenibacillus sp. MER 78]